MASFSAPVVFVHKVSFLCQKKKETLKVNVKQRLNSGPPRTNLVEGWRGLNPGPPEYKAGILTTRACFQGKKHLRLNLHIDFVQYNNSIWLCWWSPGHTDLGAA